MTQWTGLQLSLVTSRHFNSEATALTRFNGSFTLALGIVSFLVQLFATSQALRRFGLAVTILALPLSLGLGTALIVLAPAFWSVLVTNAFDQGLRFSVDRPTYELLYLPIAPPDRLPFKNAIDIIGTRVADALGAVVYGILTVGFLGPARHWVRPSRDRLANSSSSCVARRRLAAPVGVRAHDSGEHPPAPDGHRRTSVGGARAFGGRSAA